MKTNAIVVSFASILLLFTTKCNSTTVDTSTFVSGVWKGMVIDSTIDTLALNIRANDISDSLYLEYSLFGNGNSTSLLKFTCPQIIQNQVWKSDGYVNDCKDESDCRFKFFTNDWKNLLNIAIAPSFSSKSNPKSIYNQTFKHLRKDSTISVSLAKEIATSVSDAIRLKKSIPLWLPIHPMEMYGPYIFISHKYGYFKLVD